MWYRGERSWYGWELLRSIWQLPDGRWVSRPAGAGAANARVYGLAAITLAVHVPPVVATSKREVATTPSPPMERKATGVGATSAKGSGSPAIRTRAPARLTADTARR